MAIQPDSIAKITGSIFNDHCFTLDIIRAFLLTEFTAVAEELIIVVYIRLVGAGVGFKDLTTTEPTPSATLATAIYQRSILYLLFFSHWSPLMGQGSPKSFRLTFAIRPSG